MFTGCPCDDRYTRCRPEMYVTSTRFCRNCLLFAIPEINAYGVDKNWSVLYSLYLLALSYANTFVRGTGPYSEESPSIPTQNLALRLRGCICAPRLLVIA